MPLQLYEKDNILDACFDVFVRYGYSKTSTAMLAEASGISKALIFHHFKSKGKLYLSVLERCFEKMEPEIANESLSEYQDFFEAKGKIGFLKVDYLRRNPKINKFMFEAFYTTPDELKTDIYKFMGYIKKKYGAVNATKEKLMKQLFDEVPLREGVDSGQAYELINIVSDYFRKKCSLDLTDESKMLDDKYWQSFFDHKSNFLDMIRYGIEQKKD